METIQSQVVAFLMVGAPRLLRSVVFIGDRHIAKSIPQETPRKVRDSRRFMRKRCEASRRSSRRRSRLGRF
jgi:hypothetical protein